ncbi:hypothetical protein HRE53_32595 (plasmid) [Acaryochloris sp. 'Moss Beach']|uniref:hypothetical protein n=1 Tax=Acaryochloris sp. 'Moss Beach' TaxID=2740837 RepID=UPI001F3CAEDA|nr:hypothetical protein [Acaryochloris sp. 'Moss Beach']UJB73355.1 hypothetical protein HRE53_32595 [Acaryochloris sp. 'Moss Beach']
MPVECSSYFKRKLLEVFLDLGLISLSLLNKTVPDFEKDQCPLGSGMIESACKWLIQQRFKGVGMRWSEDGFNHLLHLRLDWVNQHFDTETDQSFV